jgi:hypothetical protein
MMEIQSLSVVVPSKGCINDCQCCVSKMNTGSKCYKNQLEENLPFTDLYYKDYLRRLRFCRDQGVNTVMITGDCEPQQNTHFLKDFGNMMNIMGDNAFPIIEIQTTGVKIDDQYLRFLRNHVGISTISMSLFSFSNDHDWHARGGDCGTSRVIVKRDIKEFCDAVKKYDFNLRLSLNLTDHFEIHYPDPRDLFEKCRELGADQVTLRKLYDAGDCSPQSKWVKDNKASDKYLAELHSYITFRGRKLRTLEYGYDVYSIHHMSTVLDTDCMSEDADKTALKYLILRPNGKLYSLWDDASSLIF